MADFRHTHEEFTSIHSSQSILKELVVVVGVKNVLTGDASTRRYRTGFRFGSGNVLAVVRPANLVELWRVSQKCISANKIVIMQASNTGLTGGSTPDGNNYDRDIVIISTLRMDKVQLLGGGKQVICFPGATLHKLEKTLKPLDREPHSVIGSSCIGASVFGGVSNNSGGALIRRGPAFTEMALYAQVTESGTLRLVNHLGIQLGKEPEEILNRLEEGQYSVADVEWPDRHCSDHNYAQHVREIDATTPARFNADTSRLFEASGSAGRLILFALRLDTFPHEHETSVFYIGTNSPKELAEVRREMLASSEPLPIAAEYMHRDAFNMTEVYGKDTFLAIKFLGSDRLQTLFRLKSCVDALAERLGLLNLSDKILQAGSEFFPNHLPRRMLEFREQFEHHLVLKVAGSEARSVNGYLERKFSAATGSYFKCSSAEAGAAFLHRFAAAGAAIRYRAIHSDEVEEIVALDIALRRNDVDWVEKLPSIIENEILHKLYYGHFFCQVFHHDYIVRKGSAPLDIEHRLWDLLDLRGAEYPAEHNVGHLYKAKPLLASHYKELDPCNCLNPGIGHTSKLSHWR